MHVHREGGRAGRWVGHATLTVHGSVFVVALAVAVSVGTYSIGSSGRCCRSCATTSFIYAVTPVCAVHGVRVCARVSGGGGGAKTAQVATRDNINTTEDMWQETPDY